MNPTLNQQLLYGRPGDPIPGSHLVRAYCYVCGEPMRVSPANNPLLQECQDCRGAIPRKVLSQERALRTEFGRAVGRR